MEYRSLDIRCKKQIPVGSPDNWFSASDARSLNCFVCENRQLNVDAELELVVVEAFVMDGRRRQMNLCAL